MKKNIPLIGFLYFVLILGGIDFAYPQENDLNLKVQEHYRIGNRFYEEGKYKEAQEEFSKADVLLKSSQDSVARKESLGEKQEPAQKPKAELTPAKEAKTKEVALKIIPVVKEESNGQISEYLITTEDILQISVWENPDLTQEVPVRPDGRISVSLIGDILVAGMTIPQVDDFITEKLKDYIKDPQVTVGIKKMAGTKIILLGQVGTQGVYSVTGEKSILEAIAMAGGFTKDAVLSSVIVIRKVDNKYTGTRVNLTKALAGKVNQDLTLKAEDVVFVPKKFIADVNYFLDAVLGPISKGLYSAREIQNFGASSTVTTVPQ